MTEKRDPKWKRFEGLVAKLQQEFTPDAKVTLNDKIIGRNSGVSRQIDISVRKQVGQFSLLIVLDCKDHSDPVDVKDVEEFLGLVDDVGAHKGALVSSSGFTEAAKTRARNAGVDVYRLVDAEGQDWRSYVATPVVCDFRGFGSGRFRFSGSKAICNELALQEPKLIPIYDKTRKQIGTPLTLLWAMWNQREVSEEPGLKHVLIKPGPIFVRAQNSHFEQIEILGEFEVLRKLYFGELPLTKITGLKDEVTGNLVLPGNTEIITDVIDPVDVERNWQRIPSLDALAVKPAMVLTAFDYYPVPNISDTPQADGA